ncbi:GntR family transcriptional regulator [Rhizobium sp. 16-449-1b]|uniref:GntR family transcriptional regulator n=1 Tax=Rhizobium sp. 16-449-1b TaxID=2819989 RepID=UPI001ADB320D|nr:GntR family transcriptional regulator [Rhizobium sp. 16-449-1b]MBO9195318.1 GntR family transcriptional regulator [Rhizobium sp. 16-449-1b]
MKASKRYAEIAQQLSLDIANGVYPVGSTLPSEPALAEALGVSRSTVRAALGELQKLGMVSRRPSLGTRIEASQPLTSGEGFSETLSSIEAIIQYAANTLRDGLTFEQIVLDDSLATRLQTNPGSKWLKVSYLRVDKLVNTAPPICWTDVYVDRRYASFVSDRMALHVGAVSELVEEAAGRPISQVEQSLRGVGVPAQYAEALKAPVDGHALEITRRYFLGTSELVLASISIHPGDRFTYVSRLMRHP